MSGFYAVIPARYASARLPGKPLAQIAGRPMVRWVWELTVESGADRVCVATDHEGVAKACRDFGAEVVMTSEAHASGSDRIAAVAQQCGWHEDAIVVNVQGDEPLLPSLLIRQVAGLLQLHTEADMGTLGTPIHDARDYLDPNVVKLVMRLDGAALYFSRAPIPWHRDHAPETVAPEALHEGVLRHLGLYSYRVGALQRLASTPPCRLEEIERLEQLRALWLGMRIQVDAAVEVPPAGVDTPDDLARVNRLIRADRPAR